ncbi:VOC family protein [Nocardioides sp. InS609-2]|uniref:VOC family protein n=1 Tax=Nocardioides sp. InS609-2 TaxID=2760705 RepID=UPI0020BD64F6|nr:VOC family protein [Nocardioides sp. InS609-2]
MHRSRIGVVLIDHPASSYDAASAFWASASGSTLAPEDETYSSVTVLPGGVKLEAQRLGDDTTARIHLDIETDDVRAEVARVVALGATVVEDRAGYVILTDPGGLVFCVVPVQTGADFEEHAVTWT